MIPAQVLAWYVWLHEALIRHLLETLEHKHLTLLAQTAFHNWLNRRRWFCLWFNKRTFGSTDSKTRDVMPVDLRGMQATVMLGSSCLANCRQFQFRNKQPCVRTWRDF